MIQLLPLSLLMLFFLASGEVGEECRARPGEGVSQCSSSTHVPPNFASFAFNVDEETADCQSMCTARYEEYVAGCQAASTDETDPFRAQRELAACLRRASTIKRGCENRCERPPPDIALPRPPAGSVRVQLTCDRVQAIDNGEAGQAEPYLWTAFMKLDATNVRISGNRLEVVGPILTRATAGFSVAQVDDGGSAWLNRDFIFETVLVPLQPLPGIKLALLGRISLLWEHDSFSDSIKAAGARAFYDAIEVALQDIIPQISLSTLLTDPTAAAQELQQLINQAQQQIVNKVEKALKDGILTGFNVLPVAVGSPDDLLGKDLQIIALTDGIPSNLLPSLLTVPTDLNSVTPVDSDIMSGINTDGTIGDGADGVWRLFGSLRRLTNY